MEREELILDDEPSFISVNERKKLPVFLKVLCILTFTGSALTILIAFGGMKLSGSMIESFSERSAISQIMGAEINYLESYERKLINYYTWLLYFSYALLAGSILCIIGSTMMLFRNRTGFLFYITGETAPVILFVFVIIAARQISSFDIIEWALYAAPFFISITFIVMYSVNSKYLGKNE